MQSIFYIVTYILDDPLYYCGYYQKGCPVFSNDAANALAIANEDCAILISIEMQRQEIEMEVEEHYCYE